MEELRNIFLLNDDTVCDTHDLIRCKCSATVRCLSLSLFPLSLFSLSVSLDAQGAKARKHHPVAAAAAAAAADDEGAESDSSEGCESDGNSEVPLSLSLSLSLSLEVPTSDTQVSDAAARRVSEALSRFHHHADVTAVSDPVLAAAAPEVVTFTFAATAEGALVPIS
jgi:hypothetical protein